MKILTIAGMILAGAATAGIYDAGLYSQVPLTDVSEFAGTDPVAVQAICKY